MIFLRRFFGVMVILMWGTVALAGSPLEKLEWRMAITKEGETSPNFIDRIRFQDGNFRSVIFNRYGFPSTSYSASKEGEGVSWEVNQKNETQGSLKWKGELKGEVITGTLVWKKPDGKVFNFVLAGDPAPPLEGEEAAPAAGRPATPEGGKASSGEELPWWKKYLPSFSKPKQEPAPSQQADPSSAGEPPPVAGEPKIEIEKLEIKESPSPKPDAQETGETAPATP